MNVSAETLKAQLKSVGLYREFTCIYCERRDIFVSGPHSHVCVKCGGQASGGWYTAPWCDSCKQADGRAYPDWEKPLKKLEFAEVEKLD